MSNCLLTSPYMHWMNSSNLTCPNPLMSPLSLLQLLTSLHSHPHFPLASHTWSFKKFSHLSSQNTSKFWSLNHGHPKPIPSSWLESCNSFPTDISAPTLLQSNSQLDAGKILLKHRWDHVILLLKVLQFLSFSLRVKGSPYLLPWTCQKLLDPSPSSLATPAFFLSLRTAANVPLKALACHCCSLTWNVLLLVQVFQEADTKMRLNVPGFY